MTETVLEKLMHGERPDNEDQWGVLYISTNGDGDLSIQSFFNLDDKTSWIQGVAIGMAHLAINDPIAVSDSFIQYLKENPEVDEEQEQTAEDLPEWAKLTRGKPN
jgi:hypothetical protein